MRTLNFAAKLVNRRLPLYLGCVPGLLLGAITVNPFAVGISFCVLSAVTGATLAEAFCRVNLR